MTHKEFWTMREIGRLFGITSHKVGKTLKKMGLRTQHGKPSQKAFDEGYVQRRWGIERQEVYNWAWNRSKVVALLKEAGFKRIEDDARA